MSTEPPVVPANPVRIPITGHYVYKDGTPARGTVILRGSQPLTVDGTETIILPLAFAFELDENGSFSGEVAATNDPLVQPLNWPYRVEECIPGLGRKPFATFVDYQLTTIDMADLVPVVPPPLLVSTKGPKGDKGDPGKDAAAGGGGISLTDADARYVAKTQINQPSGVAGLDTLSMLTESVLPLPAIDLTVLFENKLI